MLLLAGTSARRQVERERLNDLLEVIDWSRLGAELTRQRLLPLLGSRLAAMAEDRVAPEFAHEVERATLRSRRQAFLLQTVSDQVTGTLEAAGIPAVPLKGAGLAADVHRDIGLRISGDVDVLVPVGALAEAVTLIQRHGYDPPQDPPRVNGLPLLHYTLRPQVAWRPTVELHWRVHWYEQAFSADAIRRSHLDGEDGRRRLALEDELVTLLLYYARDGFAGLRYPVDIAAWWDVNQERAERRCLDGARAAYPELAPALRSSVAVLERLVGVPAERLISDERPRARGRWAGRLAAWTVIDSDCPDNRTLIDLLLSPPGEQGAGLKRHVLLSAPLVVRAYSLQTRDVLLARLLQLVHPVKMAIRYAFALWRIRAGRTWVS